MQPYSSGVPLYWTAYVTYTNTGSSTLTLNCPADVGDLSAVQEHMSGGSGDDGSVAAESTTCTNNPNWSATVPPGSTAEDYATFHNVPWPGSAVALTWATAGTSPYVYPFQSSSSPSPHPTCTTPVSNTNPAKSFPWAGYGLYPDCGTHATSVTATWRVPAVNCTKSSTNTRTAVWVGMWGYVADSWLPQIGTDSDCQFGYAAVYQLPNSGPGWLTALSGLQYGSFTAATVRGFAVHPGNLISASVTYKGQTFIGQRTFKIWIKNQSTGKEWSRDIMTPIPASLDQVAGGAGAIVEDDPGGLAKFNPKDDHQLHITGLRVTFDTNPAHWTATPYRIALNGHYLVGPVSKLTSGGSFIVTWKATK